MASSAGGRWSDGNYQGFMGRGMARVPILLSMTRPRTQHREDRMTP